MYIAYDTPVINTVSYKNDVYKFFALTDNKHIFEAVDLIALSSPFMTPAQLATSEIYRVRVAADF
jgi:hypothetical protein